MIVNVYWPTGNCHELLENNDKDICAVGVGVSVTDYVVIALILKEDWLTYDSDSINDKKYTCVASKTKQDTKWEYMVGEGLYVLIEYCPPILSNMQFIALDPLSLILPEKKEFYCSRSDHCSQSTLENFGQILSLRRHEAPKGYFDQVIVEINLFSRHFHNLNSIYSSANAFFNPVPRDRFQEALQIRISATRTPFFILDLLTKSLTLLCKCAGQTSKFLNNELIPFVKISATAQQIDLRCQQLCYFPIQYKKIYHSEPDHENELPYKTYPDYIRFYNTIWLILNDISLGLIASALITENSEVLCSTLSRLIKSFLYDYLKTATVGLANNPFGIKLNGELANFLSDLFLWFIEFFNTWILIPISDELNLRYLLFQLSYMASILGISMTFAIVTDILTLISFHVYVFYRIMHKLYSWELKATKSLFYLSCGKKINNLRNRIDYQNFELDQLLMGVLFFIILIFLTPTIFSFYICYTFFQFVSMLCEMAFESIIALVNHFPLFALLLRAKDRYRIPGGLDLHLISSSKTITRFKLINKPLEVKAMFQPYILLMSQLFRTYFSVQTISRIFRGHPIMLKRYKLYLVLYSSLPKELNIAKQELSTSKSKLD